MELSDDTLVRCSNGRGHVWWELAERVKQLPLHSAAGSTAEMDTASSSLDDRVFDSASFAVKAAASTL